MHERAVSPLLSAERRQAILDALTRDGKVVAAAPGGGARRVRGHRPPRPARARRAGARPARARRSASRPAPASPASFSAGGVVSAAPSPRSPRPRSTLLAGARGDHPRRLDHDPRARPAPADRPRLHRAHQLTPGRGRARRASDRRGRGDRRPASTSARRSRSAPRPSISCAPVHADACVLGVCSAAPRGRASPPHDLEEAHVKRAMVEALADVIALATADKLAPRQRLLVAPVAELTHVVARRAAPDELLDPLPRHRRHGDARMTRRWATTGCSSSTAPWSAVGRPDPMGPGALRPLQEHARPRPAGDVDRRHRRVPIAGQAIAATARAG